MAELDRRAFLTGLAGLAATAAAPGAALAAPKSRVVPLPSPARVRADFQRMVDFGPRYTGTAGHAGFIDWLERELVKAGVQMYPRQSWPLEIWEASGYGLELLDGPAKGRVKTSGYIVRSQATGPAGVTGPLVYAGPAPA